MHKKNLALVTISFLALTVFFTGCDFNLFSAIDRPSLPSASEIDGRTIESDADAQDFLSDVEDWQDGDVLTGDKDAADAVVAKLEEVYNNTDLETETQQEAAVLAGEIAFTSNEDVAELEDNVLTTLTAVMEADGTPDSETLLNDLIPEDITQDDFTEMVNSLLSAQKAYDAYGGTLETDGSVLNLTDGDTGTIAQRALISGIVYHAVDELGSGDTEAGTQELYKLIDDDPDNDPTTDLSGLMDVLDSGSSNPDNNLINIMEAAGMADML